MTTEQIIQMARKAGGADIGSHGWVSWVGTQSTEFLERFAALVADAEAKRIYEEGMVTVGHMREQILAEREACAKVCEERLGPTASAFYGNTYAAAIRARGQA